MDKKEARKILGVTKEASRNDIEKKYAILLKKHKLSSIGSGSRDDPEDTEDPVCAMGNASAGDGPAEQDMEVAHDQETKTEEYDFEKITEAYNVLMGFDVKIKEEPPSRIAPLLDKIGIDEKKARNFLYYHKYHIIIAIVLVIAVVFFVRGCVNRVEPDFNIVFMGRLGYIDASEKLTEIIKENIPDITEPGIDGAFLLDDDELSEQQYAMQIKATALIAAGEIDVFILDRASYERFAKLGVFMSLDEIAPRLGIDMEKHKEYILRVEREEYDSGDDRTESVAEESPEHLYGIDVRDSKVLNEAGIIGDEMIAAIFTGCKQADKAERFLEFLME
ncbi:MAG: hypothetical protein ACOX4M_03405 [Acetivibrionales bacterium]|jgi:hypothetical protein